MVRFWRSRRKPTGLRKPSSRAADHAEPFLLLVLLLASSVLLWRYFVVPCWAAGVLTLTLFAGVAYALYARDSGKQYRERTHRGLCVSCGYDLRESRNQCPECGRPIDEWQYTALGSRETRNARRALIERPSPPNSTIEPTASQHDGKGHE